MRARTHDLAAITGLTLVVILGPVLPPLSIGTCVAALLANQLGGIAPDIDQPTAPFWRNLPIGGYFGRIIARMLGGHRFLTHSVIGLCIMGFLMDQLLRFVHPLFPSVQIDIVWWAFMIGMLSHLIMDTFTKEGVPWLLPIPVKFGVPPVKRLRITTGEWVENFVIFPALGVFLLAIWTLYYDQLITLL